VIVSPAPPPPPAPIPPTAPVPASAKLLLRPTHGSGRSFAVVGERVVIAGSVTPFVPGQQLLISVYRNGRKTLSKRVSITASRTGPGRFHLSYASPRPGLVRVRAEHLPTAQMGGFTSSSAIVRFYGADLRTGSRGPAVWTLQRGLAVLRYEVPLSGYFDEATARAVVTYRKVIGLPRIESTGAHIFSLLQRGAGRFRARFPRDGDHVEADLNRQVLVEVERRGRVRRIYTMSSGKPSTPSPLGSFRVYEKTVGTNAKGMVDSNYFIGGYAIHGYPEVPVYAASHGCLRIPIPNAAAVFGWVRIGYRVDVYR
jgi:L,D-transpeptidase-like protein